MTNDTSIPSAVVIAPSDTKWLTELQQQLYAAGYQLRHLATYDDVQDILGHPQPDAVIAVDSTRSLHLFDAIRNHDITPKPLLILIQHNQHDEIAQTDQLAMLPPVDLILPPNAAYIRQQLDTFLKLRNENATLQQQNKTLDTRLTDLQTNLLTQQRNQDQIELLKNAIVRNVGHELRTPLLQMKSAISLIKDGMTDQSVLRYAEEAMARLETHVNNITMLGSSLDPSFGPIVLRDAVNAAMRSLGRVWRYKGAIESRIVIDLEAKLPPIKADKQGLNVVLQALLDNALKFSDKNSQSVTVRAHADGDFVVIAVVDEGIGIAKDQLEKIFELFYQVDHSSTRRFDGMGVGLALVKLILDLHQVQIEVESEPGRGSKFYFKLPVVHISDGK